MSNGVISVVFLPLFVKCSFVEVPYRRGCIVNSIQFLFVIHTLPYLHIGSTQAVKAA